MCQLLCISTEPCQLLYEKNSDIHKVIIHNHDSIQNIYKCFDEIKYMILGPFPILYVISPNYILEYKISGLFQLQRKIKINHKFLQAGIYNPNNQLLYCVDDFNLYLYNNYRICCSFPNIRKYLLDKYRYFSLDTKHFLTILKYNNFCVYFTKKMIENILKILWKFTQSFKMKFQCIHKDNFIFLIEDKKQIVSIHCKTFLLEFIEIEHYVGNYFFQIVQDVFLYLIVCVPDIHHVNLQYYVMDKNNVSPIFEHSFHFPHSCDISQYYFYFFQNEHFVKIISRKQPNGTEESKVAYLFHVQEKLKTTFQFEKNEKFYLKNQIQYFTSILYQKNNRIENDTTIKTLGKCCICYENNVSILFLPCAHICSCSSCGMVSQVHSCPLCRGVILMKKPTFILSK